MKKIILYGLVLLTLVSCSSLKIVHETRSLGRTDRVISKSVFDFRPYAQRGFFVSEGAYYGDCLPLGDFTLTIEPEQETFAKMSRWSNQERPFDVQREVVYAPTDANELLSLFVEWAEELGADGIMNLSLSGPVVAGMFTENASVSGTFFHRGYDTAFLKGFTPDPIIKISLDEMLEHSKVAQQEAETKALRELSPVVLSDGSEIVFVPEEGEQCILTAISRVYSDYSKERSGKSRRRANDNLNILQDWYNRYGTESQTIESRLEQLSDALSQ